MENLVGYRTLSYRKTFSTRALVYYSAQSRYKFGHAYDIHGFAMSVKAADGSRVQ